MGLGSCFLLCYPRFPLLLLIRSELRSWCSLCSVSVPSFTLDLPFCAENDGRVFFFSEKLVPFTKLESAASRDAVILTFIAMKLQILDINEREISERVFSAQNQARHCSLTF